MVEGTIAGMTNGMDHVQCSLSPSSPTQPSISTHVLLPIAISTMETYKGPIDAALASLRKLTSKKPKLKNAVSSIAMSLEKLFKLVRPSTSLPLASWDPKSPYLSMLPDSK